MSSSLLQTVITSQCSRQIELSELDTPGKVSSIEKECKTSQKLHRTSYDHDIHFALIAAFEE